MSRLTKAAYEGLVLEDIEVLNRALPEASLERHHIEDVLRWSVMQYYPQLDDLHLRATVARLTAELAAQASKLAEMRVVERDLRATVDYYLSKLAALTEERDGLAENKDRLLEEIRQYGSAKAKIDKEREEFRIGCLARDARVKAEGRAEGLFALRASLAQKYPKCPDYIIRYVGEAAEQAKGEADA